MSDIILESLSGIIVDSVSDIILDSVSETFWNTHTMHTLCAADCDWMVGRCSPHVSQPRPGTRCLSLGTQAPP